MHLDFDAIRKETDAAMGPEWTAEQREATWRAAMALIGEEPLVPVVSTDKSSDPPTK